MIWIYLSLTLGFALPVAHERGWMVGIVSAIFWPVLLGMLLGWKSCRYDGQFQKWINSKEHD